MILALLLAVAQPATAAIDATPAQSAIDAERAFAADAQKLGQWTAFRKYAADDAVMFLPQPGSAKEFLKEKADPPVAVFWWPGKSFVSCDGGTAINTGPWVRQWGKSVGYFTTVWQRQPDGNWKWQLDHGDTLDTPRSEGGDIKSKVAMCGKPSAVPPPPKMPPNVKMGEGSSRDGTLRWRWMVRPDGERQFQVWLWNGRGWDRVVDDVVRPTTP